MATFELELQDLGEGVVEGEIVKWLVKPGESVEEDQGLVEVMTGKATVTVPAPRAGKVVSVHGKEGRWPSCHHTLLTMESSGRYTGPPSLRLRPRHRPVHLLPSVAAPMAARAVDAEKVLATRVTRRRPATTGSTWQQSPGPGPRAGCSRRTCRPRSIWAVRPSQ